MRRISAGLWLLSSVAAIVSLGCAFSVKREVDGTGGATSSETGGATGSGGSPFFISDAAVELITVDASGEAAPSVDANCGNVPFGVMPGPADVLIVLDKSGSMAMDANGRNCGAGSAANCSKWVQVTEAINTVVGQTPGINWGLKFFATANGCGVNAGAEVPVGPGTAPMIAAAIAATGPASSTPTTAAELAAGAYMATLTDTNKKFILLATDGQPTCAGGNGNNGDDTAAIASVLTVFNGTPSFPTFVVGIATSGGAGDTTLSQMAVNGGHPRVPVPTATDPGYYSVATTADLVTALNAITSIVKGMCDYPLPPPDSNADQSIVTVTVDGVPSVQNDQNGWTYNSTKTSLTFTGTTCAQLLAGTSTNVQVLYGCKVINPI